MSLDECHLCEPGELSATRKLPSFVMYVVRDFVSHTSFNDAFTRSALSCLSVSPATGGMRLMTTPIAISSAVVTRREKASIITFVSFVSEQSWGPSTIVILPAFFSCCHVADFASCLERCCCCHVQTAALELTPLPV